jgi:hypothetical protein
MASRVFLKKRIREGLELISGWSPRPRKAGWLIGPAAGSSPSTSSRNGAKPEGEGYVCVELLFLPSVYTPCPSKGARYNAKTLVDIKMRGKSIADVLAMTVDTAFEFFSDDLASIHPMERS